MGGCRFQERASHQECPQNVDLEASPPFLDGGGDSGCEVREIGSVVNQDVDWPDGVSDGSKCCVDGFGVGDVGSEDMDGTFRGSGFEFLFDGQEMWFAAAEEDDVCGASCSEGRGDFATNASAPTRDEDCLIGPGNIRVARREGRVGCVMPGFCELGKEVGHWIGSEGICVVICEFDGVLPLRNQRVTRLLQAEHLFLIGEWGSRMYEDLIFRPMSFKQFINLLEHM